MSASPGAPNAEQLDALARAKLLLEAWGYTVLQPGESRPVGAPTPAMIAAAASILTAAYRGTANGSPEAIQRIAEGALRAALTAQTDQP